jgi:membrane peptidoglycan carboxypeptidase
MTLYDVGQAYQTLFNNGEYKSLSIFNSSFNPYALDMLNFDKKATQVYSKANAYHIQGALKTVLEPGGTGYSLNKYLPNNVQFMGKTGTTDEYRHGYSVLSDGKTLVVSWVSYGKTEDGVLKFGRVPIPNNSGGGSAGILAAFIMKEFYKR